MNGVSTNGNGLAAGKVTTYIHRRAMQLRHNMT